METTMNEEIVDKTSSSEQHKPFIILKSKSGAEHVHYSAVYEGFPGEIQARAEKELKETPEAREKGLHTLRKYMNTLRNCKYDLKKAESKLKKLLNMRQDVSIQLRNLAMEKIERIVDDAPFYMFPYRDKFGRVIVNTRPDAVNQEGLYTVADVALIGKAGILFLLSFPITTVSGFVYLSDCSIPSYAMYFSVFKELRAALDIAMAIPITVARVEVVNENKLFISFINFCKAFMSKKLASRITLHGTSLEGIHEMYGPDLLPEEYGGNAGPISSKPYKQKFLDFIRDLKDEEY